MFKKFRLLLWVFCSMFFRPRNWTVIHNVKWYYNYEHYKYPIGFEAQREKSESKSKWDIFSFYHVDNQELYFVDIFWMKFIWILLSKWITYRHDVQYSICNTEYLYSEIFNKKSQE